MRKRGLTQAYVETWATWMRHLLQRHRNAGGSATDIAFYVHPDRADLMGRALLAACGAPPGGKVAIAADGTIGHLDGVPVIAHPDCPKDALQLAGRPRDTRIALVVARTWGEA